MDWQMVGALGELIGAIAVVASLLYVGRQVRQSNRIARAEAHRDFVLAWTNIQLSTANDPRAAARFAETMLDDQRVVEMPPDEWAGYVLRAVAYMRTYEGLYRQVEERVLEPSALLFVGAAFRTATFREAWKLVRDSFTEDFRHHVDTRLTEAVTWRRPGTRQ